MDSYCWKSNSILGGFLFCASRDLADSNLSYSAKDMVTVVWEKVVHFQSLGPMSSKQTRQGSQQVLIPA